MSLDIRLAGMLQPPASQPNQVVVIDIDEKGFRDYGRWPWPRDLHAQIVEKLNALGAGPIGYQVLFLDADTKDPQGDQRLIDAVALHGRTVLPLTVEFDGDDQLVDRLPMNGLHQQAASFGHVDRTPDVNNGYGVYLYAGAGQPHWPALPLAMLITGEQEWPNMAATLAPTKASVDGWIRDQYVLPLFFGEDIGFKRIPVSKLLASNVSPLEVRNKYVLVGVTANAVAHHFHAMVNGENILLAGVELDAFTLDSLIRGAWLMPPGWILSMVIVGLGSFLAAYATLTRSPQRIWLRGLTAFTILVIVWVFAFYQHYWLPIVPWLIGLAMVIPMRIWLRLHSADLEANHDYLTGLENRRRFAQAYELEWRAAFRQHTSLSVLLIDIDYFKSFNDTFGHEAGDQTLRRVAAQLRLNIRRPRDLVIRWGGEEFLVLLPDTKITGAESLADKVRRKIEELNIPSGKETPNRYVTVSIGVATCIPEKPQPSMKLIALADTALYQAKESGRNFVYVAPIEHVSLKEAEEN